MKKIVFNILQALLFMLALSGCEVAITPLDHDAINPEVSITPVEPTTGDYEINGESGVNIAQLGNLPGQASIDDIRLEIEGVGSENFKGSFVLLDNNAININVVPKEGFTVKVDTLFDLNVTVYILDSPSCTKQIPILLAGTNTQPVAIEQNVTTDQDTNVSIVLTAEDADHDSLRYTLESNTSHGTVVLDANVVTYSPNPHYVGDDSFTFLVNDGLEDSNIATIHINVKNTQVIDSIAPVITVNGSDVRVLQNAPYSDAGATATDNVDTTVNVITSGSVDTTKVGSHIITYTATDAAGNTAIATRTVTVTPVISSNTPPIANDMNIEINGSTTVDFNLIATDTEGDDLNYSIITPPANGSLNGLDSTTGEITYSTDGYIGNTSFTYIANDAESNSSVATVNIVINDVIVPDTTKPTITINGTDLNLTVGDTYVEQGAAATDDVDGNITANIIITGTVDTNTTGTYTISYDVNDTAGNVADTATRTVTVTDGIAPVITVNGTDVSVVQNTPYSDAGATATDNVDTTVNVTTSGSVDTTTVGTYTITYTATDNAGNTDTVTRTVTVVSVNHAPVAADDNMTTNEDTLVIMDVLANDSDIDANTTLTIASVESNTSNGGRVSIVDNNITYIPALNFYGTDSFSYTVSDEYNATDTATVTVEVIAVNDKPEAYNVRLDFNETDPVVAIPFELNASDVEDQNLTYRIVGTYDGNITLNTQTGVGTYTPPTGFSGTTYFKYRAKDSNGSSSKRARVDIYIEKLNVAPVAHDINTTLYANDINKTITLLGTDANGDDLNYTIEVDVPGGEGTIVLNGNEVLYESNGYDGNTSFTYSVSDGLLVSSPATVSITKVQNTSPIAYGQSILDVNIDESRLIDLNASDEDNQTLIYSLAQGPGHGTLSTSDNNKSYTYTPDPGYSGNDSFTFKVNDGFADSNIALIYINVTKVTDTPYVLNWCQANDREVWATDGSTASLLKDIDTSGESNPEHFMEIGETYFFVANDGIHGRELWKSQGTVESTVLVKDINPDSNNSSNPENLIVTNGTLYFTADDGINGIELWKSDGTTIGTQMVKNINTQGSSSPQMLTDVNGTLYFTANDGIYGVELWRSDGTEEGTGLFVNATDGNSYYADIGSVNGLVVFSVDVGFFSYQLYTSDGTTVHQIGNFDLSFYGQYGFTTVNDTLFFSAYDNDHRRELWISDGYTAQMVKDINKDYDPDISTASTVGNSNPEELTDVNGTLYFTVIQQDGGKRELWKSDGTEAGTVVVENLDDITKKVDKPNNLISVDGTLYFSRETGKHWRVWKANGAWATQLIEFEKIAGITGISELREDNGIVYFKVHMDTTPYELWAYDTNTLATPYQIAIGCTP